VGLGAVILAAVTVDRQLALLALHADEVRDDLPRRRCWSTSERRSTKEWGEEATVMTTTRLHWNHPDLAQAILDLPPNRVRLVIEAAVRLVLDNAGLDGKLVDAILAAVDGRATLPVSDRAQLEELQQQCDNRYLDMQDQDSREPQQPIPEKGLRLFYRARALAAVLGALDGVDGPAAADIVYEAIASRPNESEIVSAISNIAG
jgi:hypothetical protein